MINNYLLMKFLHCDFDDVIILIFLLVGCLELLAGEDILWVVLLLQEVLERCMRMLRLLLRK